MKNPIVIEKAGHMAVYENAGEVGAIIDRFVRAL
jgi:pimeloyl-ACP methyl ester carboxylesterase